MNKLRSISANVLITGFLRLCIILFSLISFSQTQVGSDINGEFPYDQLGYSVALNAIGDIMVVGIPHDYNPNNIPGRVRVYQYNGDDWQQLGNDVYGTVNNGAFGLTVDINAIGNIIAIGEPDNATTSNPGNVEVYEFDGNAWQQLGQTLSGVENGDVFGNSISLDDTGTIMAVGIPSFNEDDKPGSAQVYQYDGSTWEPLGSKIDGIMNKDDFGCAVSLSASGDILAVGASSGSLNANESGYSQIFQRINNEWEQIGETILGEGDFDWLGTSLQLNNAGNIIAVGAPWYNSRTGYVEVLEFVNNSWVQKGNRIDGESEGIQLGNNISMNGNGNFLALGLPQFNYNTGGADIGKVKTYHFIQNDWINVGEDIIGEDEGDASGAVSLNDNGLLLAIGAWGNDDGGNNVGQVRVYNLSDRLDMNDLWVNETTIEVFPNPTHDLLNIQAEQPVSSIEIVNILGQMLLTSKGNSNYEQIDISGLAAGNYFVKVVVGDASQVLRVVKK